MASREEILADFQACSGIDDVEFAICQLEESDWSLIDALNKAIPSTSSINNDVEYSLPTVASMDELVSISADTSSLNSTMNSPLPPVLPNMSSMETESNSKPTFLPLLSSSFSTGVSSGSIMTASSVPNASYSGSYANRVRMLDFTVVHDGHSFDIQLPDSDDVKTLKLHIQQKTGVPSCQQDLRGLRDDHMLGSRSLRLLDRKNLSELNLPKHNQLLLVNPPTTSNNHHPTETLFNGLCTNDAYDKSSPSLSTAKTSEDDGGRVEEVEDFQLTIADRFHGRSFVLNYRPIQTVLKVKLDVASVTDISVSRQDWQGWPSDITDELSLAQIGIPRKHKLSLNCFSDNLQKVTKINPSIERESASEEEDDVEEIHDLISDDEFFATSDMICAKKNNQPLIPDDYGDETMAAIKFGEEFSHRYGSHIPSFFPGTLSDAVKESCYKPATERKILAIYVHHDSSVLTNVFCSQVLCSESVIAFCAANFVIFGWDITHSSNRSRLHWMVSTEFDGVLGSVVKNTDIERLPMLALIYRLRGQTEVFQMIHGNVSLDELMSQLMSAQESFSSQLEVEIHEEEERAVRDAVKRQQDLDFESSLMADREKEAIRQRNEAEKLEQDKLDEIMRNSLAEADALAARKKEKYLRELESRLPPEPSDETTDVTKLRFRLPEGQILQRRFELKTSLSVLFMFLSSKGFPPEEYKVLTSFPRRDLSRFDEAARTMETMATLKLFPQETLILEEK